MEFLLDAKGWEHAAAVLCLEVTFERGLSPQKFLKGKWLGTLFSDEVSEGQSHHSNLRFNYVTSQLKTHQPLPIIHSAPHPFPRLSPASLACRALASVVHIPGSICEPLHRVLFLPQSSLQSFSWMAPSHP